MAVGGERRWPLVGRCDGHGHACFGSVTEKNRERRSRVGTAAPRGPDGRGSRPGPLDRPATWIGRTGKIVAREGCGGGWDRGQNFRSAPTREVGRAPTKTPGHKVVTVDDTVVMVSPGRRGFWWKADGFGGKLTKTGVSQSCAEVSSCF